MADLQQEHHREIEGLLENIRQLSRELRLQMLIIDNFIPQEYQVCMWMHFYGTTNLSWFYSLFSLLNMSDLYCTLTSVHKNKNNGIQQKKKKLPWSPAEFYFI